MTGQELLKWRETMGYTINQAAKALGMSRKQYWEGENSRTRITRRTELACLALYVGPDRLAAPWMDH